MGEGKRLMETNKKKEEGSTTEKVRLLILKAPDQEGFQSLRLGASPQPSPLIVYFLSFSQYLNAYRIMIMLFEPIDIQLLTQDGLILLIDTFQTRPTT